MIIDERMSAFIDSLDSGNPAWLNEIEKYALDTQVPIIRRSMQSLLKFLLTYTKPKSILEVGHYRRCREERMRGLRQGCCGFSGSGITGKLCKAVNGSRSEVRRNEYKRNFSG